MKSPHNNEKESTNAPLPVPKKTDKVKVDLIGVDSTTLTL
jgi:hypothetical protein